MKTSKSNQTTRAHKFAAAFLAGILPALILLLSSQTSRADSATWTGAISGDWNDARNWSPEVVPGSDAGTDVATFAVSTRTAVLLSAFLSNLGSLDFAPTASAYMITLGSPFSYLIFSGAGITNNSGVVQNFLVGPDGGSSQQIAFYNNATAGNSTVFTLDNQSTIAFFDTSTAASGIFTANAAACDGCISAAISFNGSATAGVATLSSDGNSFGNSAITFLEMSTAGNSILIANGDPAGRFGGRSLFSGDSSGGAARVEVFGIGNLDITTHNPPGLTIGSIEGSGNVFLAANNLTVGSNNSSRTFSGVIQDQGGFVNGVGGSLTKIGAGTLTLSGANTYTGITTVSAGTLLVATKPSSGTGTNKLKVNAGALGGTGTIGGAVTVGTGSGSGAFLAPGTTSTGTLTLKKTLTFKADATYKFELKSSNAKADKVTAKGVTINSGALFSFIGLGSGTLTQGSVFTAINNTATTPISGTFSNLADGSTFTANGNNFQVNYEGGTGNDLTLTVVP